MAEKKGTKEKVKTGFPESSGGKGVDTVRYTKEQVRRSVRYRGRQDLVQALLKDEGMYSLAEVDSLMENYMKGKVR